MVMVNEHVDVNTVAGDGDDHVNVDHPYLSLLRQHLRLGAFHRTQGPQSGRMYGAVSKGELLKMV